MASDSRATSYSLRLPESLANQIRQHCEGQISVNAYLNQLIEKNLNESRYFSVYEYADLQKLYQGEPQVRMILRLDITLKERLTLKSITHKVKVRAYIQLVAHKDQKN